MLSVVFALRWQSACLLMGAIPANALLDTLEMVSAAAQVCLVPYNGYVSLSL